MIGPCQACKKVSELDRCHIHSKGAGGGMESDNLLLMCRYCHQTQHRLGFPKFVDRFPHLEKILLAKGFHVVDHFGVRKLRRV